MIRKEVADGVYLTHLPSRKFKTGFLSAQFVTPLQAETAACQALLPAVLRRGTMRCPDMESLSAALDQLYGARADYTVRKKGETQCIGFVASAIDDAFVPGGEKLLEPLASLLGELVCDPVTHNGRFLPSYVDSEKDNLADAIRSIINDKRDYADLRLLQEMCQGEPYGVSRLGDLASLEKVNGPKLHARYLQLIASSRLELFYSGQAEESRVEQALREAFSALPRENIQEVIPSRRHSAPEEPRQVTEALDVTQGKLGMGFCCTSNDVPAMMLVNALFGGTSNSKLFLNVREKLSLCYYASSQYHRSQGLITVSSGIEFANYQQAYDEILLQLQAVQRGELEDWELEGARSTLCNAFRSMGDSQGRLEDFYLGQAATGQSGAPEDFLRELQEVSLERVLTAANTVTLDTVYFLQGKEGNSHE